MFTNSLLSTPFPLTIGSPPDLPATPKLIGLEGSKAVCSHDPGVVVCALGDPAFDPGDAWMQPRGCDVDNKFL